MKILKEVLSLPTAPFHEGLVLDHIIEFCSRLKLPLSCDRVGNIVVKYKKGKAKQPVAFVAHTDHPGFEVVSIQGKKLCRVGVLGGVNLDFFAGSHISIWSGDRIVKGVVAKKPSSEMWHGKPCFDVRTSEDVSVGDFAWYDLLGCDIKNGLVMTKAADNLVSVAALLDLLKRLKESKAQADVRCLFTRGEEVGFIGCMSHLKLVSWPKDLPTIVLECSSAKAAKVEIGGGPVIRVGDKMSGFTPKIDCWLSDICSKIANKNKKFKYQRALLSGGRCEASVFNLYGLSVGGLAFPLGNYHNNAEKTYACEYVGKNDYLLMRELLFAAATAGKVGDAFDGMKADLLKNHKGWAPLLDREF